jgi:hypothetical protein
MRKYLFIILPLVLLILAGCGAPADIYANPGVTFTLAIGQSASLNGEDLVIRFADVIGDSRCAAGVVCIWAGEASCLVKIDYADKTFEKVLTQPGATEPAQTDFADYTIAFDLKPYPQAGDQIQDKEYRLDLDISRKTS